MFLLIPAFFLTLSRAAICGLYPLQMLSCEIDADIDTYTMKYYAKRDKLSPIIYDNLDIDKKYRMAVAIQRDFNDPISLCLMD